MNERIIQNAVYGDLERKGYALACPNYTPKCWFECDIFGVTKSGFAVEFEVKISVADFRADVKKGPSDRDKRYYASFANSKIDLRSKHERLAAADEKGPSRFFYVVPDEMILPTDVPVWAGLMFIREWRKGSHVISVAKDAPKLHKAKVEQSVMDHVRSVFYWRYWNLRLGLKEEVKL